MGANGSVWAIATGTFPGGHPAYPWKRTTWTAVAGAAVNIAVDPHRNPWVINSSHRIYDRSGTTWPLVASAATDISADANGSV